MNIKKVVITGPESTGKTSLSIRLAEEFQTVWVPEFAREYLLKLPHEYKEEDLLSIAQGQLAAEDALLNKASDFLFCDTDLIVIKIWSEFKYGRCHPWILEQISQRIYDLYLLCYIDIPWKFDPLREHPELRDFFYQVYIQELKVNKKKIFEIKGDSEVRFNTAINAVNILL